MPTFQNVNSGQVVHVEADPSHLDGLARWARITDGPSAPVAAAQEAQEQLTEAHADAVAELADLNAQLDTPSEQAEPDVADAPLPKPAADAKRDRWIDYALANGKTKSDVHNVKTTVIAGWFE